MEQLIFKHELFDILKQGYPDIPSDADIYVTKDGKVLTWCDGFKQPEWLPGVHYMSPDATIEIYDLGSEVEWDYVPFDKEQVIRALRQFDEGVYGENLDFEPIEKIYDRLNEIAKEKGFSCGKDLIDINEYGL